MDNDQERDVADDDVILQLGDEPSERTTNAMVAIIKSENPELWDRLKVSELDLDVREDEFFADIDGFLDKDPDLMPAIRRCLADRFPLNSAQISVNLMRVREIAFNEAKATSGEVL